MAAKLAGPGGGRFQVEMNADINVTPFVDVMLVLLIIFMVAAPLATTSLKIDLPPAQAPKNPDQKKPTFLSITRGGVTYVISPAATVKVGGLDQLIPTLTPYLDGTGPLQDRTVLI